MECHRNPAYLRKVQGEHHAIHDAIAARAAMRAHLENSIKRYSRYEAELTGMAREPAKTAKSPKSR